MSEIAPLHSSLGNRARLHLKKQKRNNNKKECFLEKEAPELEEQKEQSMPREMM